MVGSSAVLLRELNVVTSQELPAEHLVRCRRINPPWKVRESDAASILLIQRMVDATKIAGRATEHDVVSVAISGVAHGFERVRRQGIVVVDEVEVGAGPH